ncbi:hypothetical protein HK102_000681, partial [Quaeritorhiza haematococci]
PADAVPPPTSPSAHPPPSEPANQTFAQSITFLQTSPDTPAMSIDSDEASASDEDVVADGREALSTSTTEYTINSTEEAREGPADEADAGLSDRPAFSKGKGRSSTPAIQPAPTEPSESPSLSASAASHQGSPSTQPKNYRDGVSPPALPSPSVGSSTTPLIPLSSSSAMSIDDHDDIPERLNEASSHSTDSPPAKKRKLRRGSMPGRSSTPPTSAPTLPTPALSDQSPILAASVASHRHQDSPSTRPHTLPYPEPPPALPSYHPPPSELSDRELTPSTCPLKASPGSPALSIDNREARTSYSGTAEQAPSPKGQRNIEVIDLTNCDTDEDVTSEASSSTNPPPVKKRKQPKSKNRRCSSKPTAPATTPKISAAWNTPVDGTCRICTYPLHSLVEEKCKRGSKACTAPLSSVAQTRNGYAFYAESNGTF